MVPFVSHHLQTFCANHTLLMPNFKTCDFENQSQLSYATPFSLSLTLVDVHVIIQEHLTVIMHTTVDKHFHRISIF